MIEENLIRCLKMNIGGMNITHFSSLLNCILISESHWEQQPTQVLHVELMVIANTVITLSKEKNHLIYVLNLSSQSFHAISRKPWLSPHMDINLYQSLLACLPCHVTEM